MRVSCCEQARALGRHVSVHVDMKRDKSQKDEAPVFPAQRFSEEALRQPGLRTSADWLDNPKATATG